MAGLLDDLPTRGKLPGSGSILGRPLTDYLCAHPTEPSASQIIQADEANLLLVCLATGKPQSGDARRKTQAGQKLSSEQKKRKQIEESDAAAKRQNVGSEPSPSFTVQQLRGKSKQELSDLLKQRGLPSSGRKEVLIDRLLDGS